MDPRIKHELRIAAVTLFTLIAGFGTVFGVAAAIRSGEPSLLLTTIVLGAFVAAFVVGRRARPKPDLAFGVTTYGREIRETGITQTHWCVLCFVPLVPLCSVENESVHHPSERTFGHLGLSWSQVLPTFATGWALMIALGTVFGLM